MPYGAPKSCDPEAVLLDVIDGYTSRECAKETYGVSIGEDLRILNVD
jgi:N-methylhydantoinase B/oxoprolinase/acetone carboxylase alpha subunit